MANTVLLIDAYAIIYRAFYAIPHLTAPDGQPVNAVFGFIKMVRKAIADHRPTHAAVVFDLGPPQKRLETLPSYKAQRPPTPPDLDAQLPMIRQAIEALRLTLVEKDGEEADDLIASIAIRASQQGDKVIIMSSDKDFLQLVTDQIRMARPDGKNTVLYDPAKVQERYGVTPSQMVDLLSLVGDSVDNIPGVPGIGPKTAARLLNQFGNLETLLDRTKEITQPKLRESLQAHAMQARQNRDLIRLHTDVQPDLDLSSLRMQELNAQSFANICRACGFKTLQSEITTQQQEQTELFNR
jgi:DNA polymerase-1